MRPVSLNDLQIGQVLSNPIVDRSGKLLLDRGSTIISEAQIETLLARGFVKVLPANSDDIIGSGAKKVEVVVPLQPPFSGTLRLREALQAQLDEAIASASPMIGFRLADLAQRLDELIERDADAVLAAVHLQGEVDDTASRLLHAAAVCSVIARAAGLDEPQRAPLIGAALTYDIGLVLLAPTLNEQRGGLQPHQRERVQAHATAGAAMLAAAGVDDAVWLEAVRQHHERLDGSGYPDRLEGAAIGLPGRLVGLCDTYASMLRPRAYREARLPRQAIREIAAERGKTLDQALIALLVKTLGLYPPGTFVRLPGGETALVCERGDDPSQPLVRPVITANGLSIPVVDIRDRAAMPSPVLDAVPTTRFRAMLPFLHKLWK